MNINYILNLDTEKMKSQILSTCWVYSKGNGKLNPKSGYKLCASSPFHGRVESVSVEGTCLCVQECVCVCVYESMWTCMCMNLCRYMIVSMSVCECVYVYPGSDNRQKLQTEASALTLFSALCINNRQLLGYCIDVFHAWHQYKDDFIFWSI